MKFMETITWNNTTLGFIIRAQLLPDKTTFPIPPESTLQVGFIVYPKGSEITRHVHRQTERHIIGTPEVLIVSKGHCEVDIYDNDRKLVTTRELQEGDIVILLCGGHGFRILQDTILLEVKQGPYLDTLDKEKF